jgi:hypothetical protein
MLLPSAFLPLGSRHGALFLLISIYYSTCTTQVFCRFLCDILRFVKSHLLDFVVQDAILVLLMFKDAFDFVFLLCLKFDFVKDNHKSLIQVVVALPPL